MDCDERIIQIITKNGLVCKHDLCVMDLINKEKTSLAEKAARLADPKPIRKG